ncbi:unnamed protein product [Gongylonema pulchrum]|uniref:Ephrin RBD domain-containing protein n=1 Tax=Gongylonema pulchrum TaxID=637853 RepID=A0A183DVV5_9BILA|nr:unnamed protein product [Gongylonema pulchrum]
MLRYLLLPSFLHGILLQFILTCCLSAGKAYRHHPVHDFFWNSSNPVFGVQTTPFLNVHLLDTIVIHCPRQSIQHFRNFTSEQSTLYLVSKASFDSCQLDSTSRLLGYCDQMNNGGTIQLTPKRHGSKFGRFVTFITFTQERIHCEHAAKLNPISQQFSRPKLFSCPFVGDDENQKNDDILFMTEEFNELTWKKKLRDPRIPKLEQQQFGLPPPSIVASSKNRVFRKFPLIRKIEDDNQPVPFLRRHHGMRRRPKTSRMHDNVDGGKSNERSLDADKSMEIVPRYRKLRRKSGRFVDSRRHFWSPKQFHAESVTDEVESNPNAVWVNDITSKVAHTETLGDSAPDSLG